MGKIELLLGLDAGHDFFPKEISTYRSGLKISEYRIHPSRFLGFSGSFPAKYPPMYSPKDHPKTLLIQEDPKSVHENGNSVFRAPASATMKR